MKRISLFFMLFLTAYISICAQVTQTETTPQSENKMAWVKFAPNSEEFSVEEPTSFLPGIINTADPKNLLNRLYRTFTGNTYFYIFSDPLKNPFQNKTAFDFAGGAADRNLENVIFRFTDNMGYRHRLLMVKTPDKIYTFQTLGEQENDPLAERFFRGIKINGKALEFKESLPVANPNTQPTTTNNAANTPSDEKKPSGSGIGSGIGAGRSPGIGPGSTSRNNIGNGSAPEIPRVEAIPLKIISKPRPAYTDYARIYEITGVVRLKVTFLANGNIGSVTTVSKLPFGLMEQAISAVRQIKFEPQQVNGQLQTVTKTVEYQFSIF